MISFTRQEKWSVLAILTKIKLAWTVGKAVYDATEPYVTASVAMRKAAKVMEAAADVQEEIEKDEPTPPAS
jgi:hypothetical protein